MKRPEGFDERPERPAAQPTASEERARSDDRATSRGRRFGRRVPRPTRPADGLEARPASAPSPDVDDVARSAGGLPDPADPAGLPAVEHDAAPETQDQHRTGRVGGVTDVIDLTRASRPDQGDHDVTEPIGAGVRAAETAREARAARKRRRLLERAEIRRFTRRSRHRRVAWATAGGVVLVLVVSVLVAVYSPLMALRTIEVKGADRVDATEVRQALAGQIGRPLARLDFGAVKKDLAAFPLIESYVTEEAPPSTLVVTITERTPIVAVRSGSGYSLVDPAGIVVQSSPKPPATMPVADVRSTQLGSSVFRTMTEVVLALPSTVRAQVTEVTASTADDVTLSMRDGSKVVWGSPDASDRKAALLAALVRDHTARAPGVAVEYDVSAPDNGIVRAQS